MNVLILKTGDGMVGTNTKRWFTTIAAIGFSMLTACAPLPQDSQQPPVAETPSSRDTDRSPETAARDFVGVLDRMEPAVERECLQRRTQPINCDFLLVVDDRPDLEPNAFQTVDDNGRPIIGFTASLIALAHNSDEIAFVIGHEASHHILNHLDRKAGAATAGAVVLGSILSASGASESAVQAAQQIGASAGSRVYSKEWELEADYLGAIIMMNAGFDPMTGARFFDRLPDPGNHILGTHPSRASRLAEVRRAIEDVRSGRTQ